MGGPTEGLVSYYERAVAHRHTGRWRVITDRDRSDALRAEDTRNDQKAPEAGTENGKTFLLSLQKELTGQHLDLDFWPPVRRGYISVV